MIAEAEKTSEVVTTQERPAVTITSRQVMIAFAGLFLLNLLLRVFYLRFDFVNGDEGVRALTAARLLEGARLYADVVTDKPPGTTLFYAAVFSLAGRSMKAVHLAAAFWNFATAALVYLTAALLYSKRAGLWAALLFVYFSTNYLTQDMMAANTELLMALPYTASFYFFIKASRGPSQESSPIRTFLLLAAAGLMAAIATLFKQVGIIILAFFALHELIAAYNSQRSERAAKRGWMAEAALRLLTIGLGFVAVMLMFALWLAAMGALDDFWRNAVVLGMFYISSVPKELWFKFMYSRTLSYILFNATLWSLAVWVVVRTLSRKQSRARGSPLLKADRCVAMWGAISLCAVFAGGRFYGHYFIQVLPALSLLGSRGIEVLQERMSSPATRRSARVAAAMLAFFFLFSFVRFHQRTIVLAYETITGDRTRWSQSWGMSEREAEAEVVSRYVRGKIGEGEPLYIWDYALDVYWRTGCRPASRYLTPYYITGRFPDAEVSVDRSGEQFWREAREHLIEDLRRTRPRLILDVYGTMKSLPYPEIVEFLEENYRFEDKIGPDPSRPFFVLALKDKGDS